MLNVSILCYLVLNFHIIFFTLMMSFDISILHLRVTVSEFTTAISKHLGIGYH